MTISFFYIGPDSLKVWSLDRLFIVLCHKLQKIRLPPM